MAEANPDTRTDAAGELALLRRVLVEIESRLEPVEEWRALRQLDDRERNGNPLDGIDGVLFRGRLVQKLAETSRDWRAYVRIEEAIGQLQGPVRLEAGILKESGRFEVAKPAALIAKAAPAPAPAMDVPHKTAATVESLSAAAADAPDDATEAPEPQRVRVKVRAGSSAVSPTRPAPSPADIVIARPAPQVREVEIPSVASLTPRPLPQLAEPRSTELTTPADQRSPRSVLQRIRVVSKVRPPEASARSSDGDSGLLGAPSAPLIEPALTPQPPTTEMAAPLISAADDARGQPKLVAAWPTEEVTGTTAPVASGTERGSATAWATEGATNAPVANWATDSATKTRLDDLDAELEILIDKSASWPHPLDAHRGRDRHDRDWQLERGLPATLEPDTPVELDVDEAEVTIIRHSETLDAERLAPFTTREPERPTRLPQAVKPERDIEGDVDVSKDVDGDDYAGYHLALEEASVEIIVSGELETLDDKPTADNDRGAPDNRPTVRRHVLPGE